MKIVKIVVFVFIIYFLICNLAIASDKVEVAIINYPSEIPIGQEFEINFMVKKVNPLFDSFYYKGRIGTTDLNQGETYNLLSEKWLSDSSSWNNYFMSILNENGDATITAKLRTKANIATGPANLLIRINLNGTNYDSSSQTINILPAIPTSTPDLTTTPSSTITNGISPTLLFTQEPKPTTNNEQPTTIYQVPTNNVYISEAMVYPETNDQEWIEFFNNNDFPITLKDWYLDDLENGSSSPKKFTLDILAKSYAVFDLSFSMFNNNGDQVRLLNNNKNVIDSFEYADSEKNRSWTRIDFATDQFCLQDPTKGQPNPLQCLQEITPTNTSVTNIPITGKTFSASKLFVSPTNKIVKYITPSLITSSLNKNLSGMVLGTKNRESTESLSSNKENNPLPSFLFLSTSFPFLTIVSLFFKIKKYVA